MRQRPAEFRTIAVAGPEDMDRRRRSDMTAGNTPEATAAEKVIGANGRLVIEIQETEMLRQDVILADNRIRLGAGTRSRG